MKKYLFLDIDGVLNSRDYQLSMIESGNLLNIDIDQSAVNRFRRIVDATECEIILSSSWRGSGPKSYVPALKDAGFPIDEIPINHYTPNLDPVTIRNSKNDEFYLRTPRGIEIDMWMKYSIDIDRLTTSVCEDRDALKNICYNCDFFNYCILDDDDDMLLSQRHNYIQTTQKHGLTDAIADNVIKLLNTPYWELPHTYKK